MQITTNNYHGKITRFLHAGPLTLAFGWATMKVTVQLPFGITVAFGSWTFGIDSEGRGSVRKFAAEYWHRGYGGSHGFHFVYASREARRIHHTFPFRQRELPIISRYY